MKILMVSRWLWEERRRAGGAPGFFGELAQAIVARGVDLTILSQADDVGAKPVPRPFDGLNVHVFSREARNPWRMPLDRALKFWCGYRKTATDAAVVARFTRERGPFDAVVAQCEEPDGIACALGRPGDIPLITFGHDLRYRFRANDVRFMRKSSLGFTFRRSARVVANSAPTAGWLEREYGVARERIGQCRIHLTAPFLQQAARMSQDTTKPEPRVLFLGALNRKKAPDVFLRAAALVATELPGWKFVLVGSETERDRAFHDELRALDADMRLRDRIEMLGRRSPSAVIEQIRRAHVVVCPSRIETFSRTTIEALALGRPVIVTETTGAASWVKSTGLGAVVPPADAIALAGAIRTWAAREIPSIVPDSLTADLTASGAAEDWLREVEAGVAAHRLRSQT